MKGAAVKDLLTQARERDYKKIPLAQVKFAYNPRSKIDPAALAELKESIKLNGLLQPVIVDSEMNLIAGHRRLAAVKALGWAYVPAIIYNGGQENREILAVLENLQREGLSFTELGAAYNKIISETKLKQADIARLLGKPKSHVSEALAAFTQNPEKALPRAAARKSSPRRTFSNDGKRSSATARNVPSAGGDQLELFTVEIQLPKKLSPEIKSKLGEIKKLKAEIMALVKHGASIRE